MKLDIIDETQGIVACKQDAMLKIGGKHEKLAFCYYGEKDWIVFNAEHKDYGLILGWVREYVTFNDLQKKEFMSLLCDHESIKELFDILNQILRVRRNLQKRHFQK